ncbi:MAG: AbrB/MazE/SpoVT family DNA-binding domain-containing protein [Clostridia bacterium]|nr:AbrB/MazE/SpoVT family DNA-binding domain-containing protein [Clostridia bacterium]
MTVRLLNKRSDIMESRIIKVSNKRQITIPQKFYEKLNIEQEVECIITNSEIIIRPIYRETEFAEEILKDLIDKGFEGTQLLDEFKRTRAKVKPAVRRMIEEADILAKSSQDSGDDKLNNIFSDLED